MTDISTAPLDHSAHFSLGETREGLPGIDFSQAKQVDLRNAVYELLTEDINTYTVDAYAYRYPIRVLFPYVHRLKENDEGLDEQAKQSLIVILEDAKARDNEVFENRRKEGLVEMDHVERLFPVGCEVVLTTAEPVGGKIKSILFKHSFFGPFLQVQLEVIHARDGHPKEGVYTARVPGFSGMRKISELLIKSITPEIKDMLTRRGSTMVRHCKPGSYAAYKGALVQDDWFGPQSFRADGRIVLDPQSFQRLDSNQWRETSRASGLFQDDEEMEGTDVSENEPLSESLHWMCMPFLYGFSMTAKKWGRFNVSGLSDIQWREDAFSKVVLPEKQKKLIYSLVKHHGAGMQDLIDGKGGGCIFLLHGEPGGGKTLVSESVAEVLHKPLYSVSVGELGTNPDNLEKRLRAILDVATVWNAVILLDEADIFLEARNQTDVDRNAMVGVFLRLLEYHNGVLFMTTNRVKNIDSAFFSRISVAISFGRADSHKRQQIWHNLLGMANLPQEWAEPLSSFDVNGRQIKNSIRLAQTLALAEDRNMVIEDIQEALENSLSFETEVRDGKPRAISDHGDNRA